MTPMTTAFFMLAESHKNGINNDNRIACFHWKSYPGLSGLAASADSAETAATNPAGITRFRQRAVEVELMWFGSDSNWKSQFTDSDLQFNSKDSGSLALSYSSFEQERAVRNIFDPGFGSLEGRLKSRDTIMLQVGMTWGSL